LLAVAPWLPGWRVKDRRMLSGGRWSDQASFFAGAAKTGRGLEQLASAP